VPPPASCQPPGAAAILAGPSDGEGGIGVENPASGGDRDRLQLHLVLAYKFEPRQHPTIRGYLDRGYRIVGLQRVSDREVLVTLDRRAA